MRLAVISIGLASLLGCLSTPSPAQSAHDAAQADAAQTDATGADGPVTDAAHADAHGCTDPDGDGYLAAGCASSVPQDCAPEDGAIHPGAQELCGNSIDDDCSHAPMDPAGDIGDCPAALRPNDVVPDKDGHGTWVSNRFFNAYLHQDQAWSFQELYPSTVNIVSGQTDRNLVNLGSTEETVGTLLWPTYFSTRPFVGPTMTVLASGPAVYRQRVEWSADSGALVTGSTIYTLTPDGRIHRDDAVTALPGAMGDHLTAHIALDPAKISHLDWSWNAGAAYDTSTAPAGYTPVNSDAPFDQLGYTCAYHTENEAIIGMAARASAGGSTAGPRVSYTTEDGEHATLQYDWFEAESVTPGTYVGNFMMFVGPGVMPDICSPLDVHVQGFQSPALIDAGANTELATDGIGDDDSDGYDEGGGFYTLRATGATRTVEFTLNTASGTRAPRSTSLFRIQDLPGDYTPIVLVNDTLVHNGVNYLYQADPSGSVAWLYFHDGLTHGDKITVRTPPAP